MGTFKVDDLYSDGGDYVGLGDTFVKAILSKSLSSYAIFIVISWIFASLTLYNILDKKFIKNKKVKFLTSL